MEKDEHLNQIVTFLTDQQLAQLKRAAIMTGTPTSTLIRFAVADYLKSFAGTLRLKTGHRGSEGSRFERFRMALVSKIGVNRIDTFYCSCSPNGGPRS
jgi:hypothetical protein